MDIRVQTVCLVASPHVKSTSLLGLVPACVSSFGLGKGGELVADLPKIWFTQTASNVLNEIYSLVGGDEWVSWLKYVIEEAGGSFIREASARAHR